MARFKFGKNKKRADDTDSSMKSSIDYPRYSEATTDTYQGQETPHSPPAVPPPQQTETTGGAAYQNQHQPQPQHQQVQQHQRSPPQPDPFAPTNGAAPVAGSGSSAFGTPASAFNTPMQQFDSTLDPKINPIHQVTGSNLSPWKRHKLFNSPFPRYRHAASTFSSEKNEIYLMGGLKEGSVFGDTWRITPQLDENDNLSFTTKNVEIANNTNPPARVGHSSILCGNAFIIYGGDTVDTDFNGFPDNNFYLFNINNNKYTVPLHILNKPHGRYGHTIGVIALNNSSSRLYLFGGQLENDVFNDLYYFELNTFKSPKARWETVEPLNNFKPPPLTNHSMCIHKNRIYVFGGVYNNEKVSNDLWCFDAIINKWTQVTTTGAIPLPVNEHSLCLVNDKMYIYGGNDFLGTIYDTLYVLDLHSLVWSKLIESDEVLRNGPGPRCGHSITYLQTYKKLIIMGGDKNDYIDSNPNNFDTYEDFNGQEIGTMIYELDLMNLESFLSDKAQAKSKNSVLKKITAKKEQQQQQQQQEDQDKLDQLQQQQKQQEPQSLQQVEVSEHDEPVAYTGSVPPVVGADGYHQGHVRSFSTGPDDFRTPNGSPALTQTHQDSSNHHTGVLAAAAAAVGGGAVATLGGDHYTHNNEADKFVDFDHNDDQQSGITQRSSVLPAPSIIDEKPEQEKKLPEINPTQNYHNGHASILDNYHYIESEEKLGQQKNLQQQTPQHLPNVDNELDEDFDNEDLPSRSFNASNTTPIAPIAPLNATRNGGIESSEVKKIVGELTTELNNLKSSTTEQINEASIKISQLERENESLKASNEQYLNFDDEIKKYKDSIAERDAIITGLRADVEGSELTGTPKSISELNKYKLERLELNNRLVYLDEENSRLNDRMLKFEPFMNNQMADLSNFQKIIKSQEEKIVNLSSQVKEQEQLQKDILEWKHKFETLEVEFNNYRSIHTDDEIEISEDEKEDEDYDQFEPPHAGADTSTTRSITSNATGRRSKKDISSHLENLVHLWSSTKAVPSSANTSIDGTTLEGSREIDPIVNKLQSQVNELLSISKEQQAGSTSEINDLRLELTNKLQALKKFETNYKDALQSVNNTSKALDSTNVELDRQKELTKKLMKENEELRLYQKATKRASSRNATPISTITEEGEDAGNEGSNEEHEDINSAHYNMKIQDLQADLFIMKQERDQLKDDVTGLKKQLYLQSQN